MNRLIKLFALQTLVVAIVAIPVTLYLRSDYREFRTKQELAWRVPAGVGAVCRDGWYSGSTGSGTCSHHGGVNYWGSELRQIAQTTWARENSLLFIILAAVFIGWYGYGVRALHRKHATSNHLSTSTHLQRQCCTDSLKKGLPFCSECGAALPGVISASISPAITYILITATTFLTIGLTILALFYYRARQHADIAAAVPVATPTASPTPPPSPTPTPKPTPTATPDDLESYLDPDPLEEAVRKAKENTTPTPEPSVAIRERVVSSPTPRRTIYPESLVNASDVLSAGYTRSQDTRLYRFHLSQPARVKGTFSARGNITVYIVGGYYSSNGAISSDTIDIRLAPGTYEVVVSSREVVGFSLHLMAYYDD
jgi:hypothetical protein